LLVLGEPRGQIAVEIGGARGFVEQRGDARRFPAMPRSR
jgi:hypothetical protein